MNNKLTFVVLQDDDRRFVVQAESLSAIEVIREQKDKDALGDYYWRRADRCMDLVPIIREQLKKQWKPFVLVILVSNEP